MTDTRYVEPAGPIEGALNRAVRWFSDRGMGPAGAQTLEVTGRKTGALQRIPVNPVTVGGAEYLVSPRGLTQWVRNVRAADHVVLRSGRTVRAVTAIELDPGDDQAMAVLREYVRRWGWEIGRFLPSPLSADSADVDFRSALDTVPVFAVIPSGTAASA